MNLEAIGITPKKEKQFLNKGIKNIEDLTRFLPRRYYDFTKATGILSPSEVSCVIVSVNKVTRFDRGQLSIINAFCTIQQTKANLQISWFNQNYRYSEITSIASSPLVVVAGKIKWDEEYRTYKMTAPELFDSNLSAMKIYPVYPKIQGMSNDYLVGKIHAALNTVEGTKETLPYDIVQQAQQLGIKEALSYLHKPESMEQIEKARERLAFDELMQTAIQMEWTKRNSPKGSLFSYKTLKLFNAIKVSLPYTLTEDQDAAVNAMLEDMRAGRRICALVQGDVGCGKTIVSFLLMASLAGSGYQTVIMAPTQILAKQHYRELCDMVEPLGYEVIYIDSELKAAEMKKAKAKVSSGEAKFIVGTQSVVSSAIQYDNLALVVVDEEHRFGVEQRKMLEKKANQGVHYISMSATPIPRTLASVIYGDNLQLYTIKTMPNGRKKVITGPPKSRDSIYNFLIQYVKNAGHQAYVVCPQIEKNDKMANAKSVEEISEEYRTVLEPQGFRIATLTGKNTKEETETTISSFKNGDIDLLVSTSVIEVGVNVPNATAIVIASAERFGMASLHQLRGRVGRSSLQSYCILEPGSSTLSARAVERLSALCKTNNGFEIAKKDLELRGAGDFVGTKQAGENKVIPLILAFPEMYKKAQYFAQVIIDNEMPCAYLDFEGL